MRRSVRLWGIVGLLVAASCAFATSYARASLDSGTNPVEETLQTHSAVPELKSYSQYGQDSFVYKNFFSATKQGIFVDVGASDGIFLSNTYLFEKQLGWSGICVEPRPDKFEALVKNRSCVCVNGCITEKAGEQDFLFLEGYTGDLSGLVSFYDNRHLARIKDELSARGGSVKVGKVVCYRLADILKKCGITHIDYLSVDTEGSELSVLRSINFQEVTVGVIDVENNYGSTEIKEFLEQAGYVLVATVGCDELYRRKDHV